MKSYLVCAAAAFMFSAGATIAAKPAQSNEKTKQEACERYLKHRYKRIGGKAEKEAMRHCMKHGRLMDLGVGPFIHFRGEGGL